MAGRKDQAAGSVKKTAGKAIGNRRGETEGAAQEMAGKAKTKLGDLGKAVKGNGRSAKRGKLSRAVVGAPPAAFPAGAMAVVPQ